MSVGSLRIYLGFAPGAGTTYALLDEAHRRAARGTDVVVAAIDAKHRPATEAMVAGLEVLGRDAEAPADRPVAVALDVAAVLVRRPAVVFVDDLAATDGPTATPRWQSVEVLVGAGFDVVATLDVSHIESLADVVAGITHVPPSVRVPDAMVRSADQIQLVDQTPEALRRRLAHGNIFAPEQVDAAVDEVFKPEALTELRELTMRWMADHVRARNEADRGGGDAVRNAEVHEGILVALSGASTSANVLRRAARMADRQGARLVGVHVRGRNDPPEAPSALVEQRRLLEALGGRYVEVASDDVVDGVVRVAVTERLTQVVVGASGRTRWQELRGGALVNQIVERSPVDVHVVHADAADDVLDGREPGRRRPRPWRQSLGPTRTYVGWMLAVVLPALMALVLIWSDRFFDLAGQLILMLLAVTVAAAVGGAMVGAGAALWAFVLANWLFTPPAHQLSIANQEDALALVAFLVVASLIGSYVSLAARRSADATRARADASALAALAGTAAATDNPLPAVVDRLRLAYGGERATLAQRVEGVWLPLAVVGSEVEPATVVTGGVRDLAAPLSFDVTADTVLTIDGPDLRGIDPDVTAAFLNQLAVTLDRQRLRTAEEQARTVAAANELRAALLAAVSHDLRTPLATVKAASSALVELGDALDADGRAELAATIDVGVDRLTALIVNLLGMGRIQSGAVELHLGEVFVGEVVHRAALAIGRSAPKVDIDVAEGLPAVVADAPLLEQVVVNLIDNACKWSPADQPVRVDAAVVDGALRLRIVDRGPGIDPSHRRRVLQPFQRVLPASDTAGVEGTGLGLAVASGFCTLMGIELRLDDTPGGGTTATLVIPLASSTEVLARPLEPGVDADC